MYLLNHNIHTPRNYTDSSKRFENDSLAGDKFFENRLNEKEARFVDVTANVGIFSSFLGGFFDTTIMGELILVIFRLPQNLLLLT